MTTRFTAADVQTLDDALECIREGYEYRSGTFAAVLLANRLDALKDKLAEAVREGAEYVAVQA